MTEIGLVAFNFRPEIYLFLIFFSHQDDRFFVAFVGMSADVSARTACREVLSELRDLDCWIMRWLKATPEERLRIVERRYIGRRRGVDLS